MISILITAWKEPNTIGKAIECLAANEYSGIEDDFEILLAAPDTETHEAAIQKVKELNVENKFKYIKDPCKGKPVALNILFREAKGDIFVLTDGDVYFDKLAVRYLLNFLNSDRSFGGVSGRPVALNPRNQSIFDYWAHLQADAVHQMRLNSRNTFFPMSGYIMAIRNLNYNLPENLFLDDAYISYFIFKQGYKIGYEPSAKAFVKYPTNWRDFEKQKLRSLLGFEQLKLYSQVYSKNLKSRSFLQEFSYFYFPIRYSNSLTELVWSIVFYPTRLYLWIKNKLTKNVIKKAKSIRDIYLRTESTK